MAKGSQRSIEWQRELIHASPESGLVDRMEGER